MSFRVEVEYFDYVSHEKLAKAVGPVTVVPRMGEEVMLPRTHSPDEYYRVERVITMIRTGDQRVQVHVSPVLGLGWVRDPSS